MHKAEKPMGSPQASPPKDILAGFSANERALLERVPSRPLRRFAAAMVRTKMRLQFTGWLQFLIPLPPTIALATLGGLAQLVGLPRVAIAFALGATGLLAIVLFDLVTVKFRIRLPERRPASNEDLDVFDVMRARHSCRSFQTRLLSDEDREAVLSSVNRNVEEPTLGSAPVRLEYIPARLMVWPTVNGSEFLIAIVPKPYDRTAVIDVGRVLHKVVIDATRMGLGTCWIGPGADHESLQRHLGERFDPEREQIVCTCAVGYRSSYVPLFLRVFNRITSRNRAALSALFFTDAELTVPADPEAPHHARFGRSFEACRWAPSSYNGQTTRAVVRSDAGVVEGVDFYANTSSRFYAPVALGIWCACWELGCEAMGLKGEFALQPGPPGELVVPKRDVTWVPKAQRSAR
jgi:nitroreductase